MHPWFRTTDRFADPQGALRVAQFAAVLSRFTPGRLVDLGAGHGIFARVAADLRWRVTAVDARAERFPADPRIEWVVKDIRDFDDFDDADLVACLGLWYHLTLDDQRLVARRVAPRPLVLDTNLAQATLGMHVTSHQLGDLIAHEGLEGRFYDERELQARSTASWGNEYSFWPTAASLDHQLYEVGYDVIEHLSPPVASDRHVVVATCWTSQRRSELDEVVARYVPVTRPDAPLRALPPVPSLLPSPAPPVDSPRRGDRRGPRLHDHPRTRRLTADP